jgi:uracil-DNA glycosylase
MQELHDHLTELRGCRRCPGMVGPVITPRPVPSPVYLVGQAPGPREGPLGRPFAWTAARTHFDWFATIGVDEETFRSRAYIAAICRCFPGKNAQGGDRVPGRGEVERCSGWMRRELELLRPRLVIPVGRLAIERFLPGMPLDEAVGRAHRAVALGHRCDLVPLPHPSGASSWWKREPGSGLLAAALAVLAAHEAWRRLREPAA